MVSQPSPSQANKPVVGSCIGVVGIPDSDLPSRDSVDVAEGASVRGLSAVPGGDRWASSWSAMDSPDQCIPLVERPPFWHS